MMRIISIVALVLLFSGCAKYNKMTESEVISELNISTKSIDRWVSTEPGILISPIVDSAAGTGKGQFSYAISDHIIETKFIIFNGKVCNTGETDIINTDFEMGEKSINIAMKCEQPNTLAIMPDSEANKDITNELIQNHSVNLGGYIIPAEGFIDGFSEVIGIQYGGIPVV
ncbi:hypothetical protein [Photobacterium kishitanii]|uniref:hypothetical protein n=1 Tax=Photobacterium kishitanii TaxID=318456 RepID=UPI000434419C|nr:hypothetical protein [Photobacterium kishitanii]CEO41012.1 hypothetical protein PPBDW_II0343 [Photobacterium kishitanii]